MDLASRLTRLEIAFEDGKVKGAQATVEDGLAEASTWTPLRERTIGLDAGGHPEYATALADAVGDAAALALADNGALRAGLAERDAAIEALAGEKAELSAALAAAEGRIAAFDRDRAGDEA